MSAVREKFRRKDDLPTAVLKHMHDSSRKSGEVVSGRKDQVRMCAYILIVQLVLRNVFERIESRSR